MLSIREFVSSNKLSEIEAYRQNLKEQRRKEIEGLESKISALRAKQKQGESTAAQEEIKGLEKTIKMMRDPETVDREINDRVDAKIRELASIKMKHFTQALKKVKPTLSGDMAQRYDRLTEEFSRQSINVNAGDTTARRKSRKKKSRKSR